MGLLNPRRRLIGLSLVSAALLSACGGAGSKHSLSSGSGGSGIKTATAVASSAPKRPPSRPTRTSCRSVIYIGDSTSDGEASAEYVPDPKLRAPAQFAKVGVKATYMEVSGARSIHEIFSGIPNAAMVARRHVAAGYHGCWVLALGTNEAADVAAGSTFGLRTRIARMMSIIGNQPVLWINAITLPGTPQYYGEPGMRRWNQDLVSACARYPMMRVFDWAARAKRQWFIPDHIHYTPQGYIARTRLIAHAVVEAFPRERPPSSIATALLAAFPRERPPSASCLVN